MASAALHCHRARLFIFNLSDLSATEGVSMRMFNNQPPQELGAGVLIALTIPMQKIAHQLKDQIRNACAKSWL